MTPSFSPHPNGGNDAIEEEFDEFFELLDELERLSPDASTSPRGSGHAMKTLSVRLLNPPPSLDTTKTIPTISTT